MPIETPHPLYKEALPRWQMCRDAYEGEDAVKAAGERYLPKVDPQQTNKEYAAYLTRALYYEAVGRTVDGFVGAISRKPHVFTLPDAMKPLEKDATEDHTGLAEFVKCLAAETLLNGRSGILVNYDEAVRRPFFAHYQAENITNWNAGGVVLTETVYEPDPKDAFAQIAVPQIRQCSLVDGAYTVTLWRKPSDQTTIQGWVIHSVTVPLVRGKPLRDVPFFFLSIRGLSTAIEKPPLLGLVRVALSHYRSSADLEHGRHFTAMPTLYVTGAGQGDEPIRVGAGAAIELSNAQAKVGYAEFTGQGLGSLETAIESKEHMMAVLGAMVFGGEKKGVEAADTARLRTAGENSLLMGVVSAVEEVLDAALQCAADWQGVTGEVKVDLNKDFTDQNLDPRTLTGMVQAYQAGALSLPAFLYTLQQAEMLPPDMVIEDEVKALQAAAKKKADDALKIAAAAPPVEPAQPERPARA